MNHGNREIISTILVPVSLILDYIITSRRLKIVTKNVGKCESSENETYVYYVVSWQIKVLAYQ